MSGEGTAYVVSLSASDFRLLRLQRKNNRAMRSDMRTSPPITPPMIATVGFPGEELSDSKAPDGTLIEVGVLSDEMPLVEAGVFEEVEDVPSC
jgi:hypothetical protein